MSGDIGMGATKAAISLGSYVAASLDRPPGTRQFAYSIIFDLVNMSYPESSSKKDQTNSLMPL